MSDDRLGVPYQGSKNKIAKQIVSISEYDMPSDRFECVLEIKKQNLYCSTANKKVVERLFIPKGQRRTQAVQLTLF